MTRLFRIIFAFVIIFNITGYGRGTQNAKPAAAPQRSAILAEVKGTVEVKPSTPKAVWVAGTASTSLIQGDTIRTGKNSSAVIHINSDSEIISIELDEGSQISIARLAKDALTGKKSTLLDLAIGEAMIRTKNMDSKSSLEIKTPTSIVASQGKSSSFSVQVERYE